ncbi:hypothetical protein DFH08DRAFT_1008550 [Mycena albidolilacea]|uniref:Extracellular membrane protein CFEM domain-containing protein n=1 Tax=Mycena albidolilacea TaxID=1033008 RepID=A0AAD6ZZE5_9AGAR|nr:hypothetical protein DFH08DRAFT_1008550 [Mycena albidolilacea]
MLPLTLLLFVAAVSAASSSSRSGSSVVPSSAAPSSSNSLGTPSNSALLPTLSGVSSCVSTCFETAVGADGCMSEAAVDCFCPNPKNFTAPFVACLTACPSEVPAAEALIQSFCAAAATPTSLSFPPFTPSASASSLSNSNSNSKSGSGSGSSTAPPSSAATSPSTSASTSPNAAMRLRMRGEGGLPLLQLGASGVAAGVAAGVVAGAGIARTAAGRFPSKRATPLRRTSHVGLRAHVPSPSPLDSPHHYPHPIAPGLYSFPYARTIALYDYTSHYPARTHAYPYFT